MKDVLTTQSKVFIPDGTIIDYADYDDQAVGALTKQLIKMSKYRGLLWDSFRVFPNRFKYSNELLNLLKRYAFGSTIA